MSTRLIFRVKITSPRSPNKTFGEVQVMVWTPRERTLRAIKFSGICWGLAVLSIVIPFLHFFLVPGFLITGPIVYYYVYKQERIITEGKGTCPGCFVPLPISRTRYRFPIYELCTSCQSNLEIETA